MVHLFNGLMMYTAEATGSNMRVRQQRRRNRVAHNRILMREDMNLKALLDYGRGLEMSEVSPRHRGTGKVSPSSGNPNSKRGKAKI